MGTRFIPCERTVHAHPQPRRLNARTICHLFVLVSLAFPSIALAVPSGDDSSGGTEQLLVETFADRVYRHHGTTALWNAFGNEFLQAGYGWGGDGSDGDLILGANTVLDTTGHSGIWNFRRVVLEKEPELNVKIVGDKPAVIRVFEDLLLIQSSVRIDASGRSGGSGVIGDLGTIPGGAGGPGGGRGGDASPGGPGSARGEDGQSAFRFGIGGGGGGVSGARPGGGGGGGHDWVGMRGWPGADGGEQPGDGGAAYQGPWSVSGGGGGGAGGNLDDGAGALGSGGSGGGGGGGLLIDVRGSFGLRYPSWIHADGGRGGHGARGEAGVSAGGGGGAGGVVRVRSSRVLATTGEITARGNSGGVSGENNSGRGGGGSTGAIYTETLNGSYHCNCSPSEHVGSIDPSVLGISRGRSRFRNTGFAVGQPRFAFDGSNPLNGRIRVGPGVQDIRFVDASGATISALPDGIRAYIGFSAAEEHPTRPGLPDPATKTRWVTDISELDGLPLIRFMVVFVVPPELLTPEYAFPGVDDVRIRYSM